MTLWINPVDNPDQHIRSNCCCLIKTQKALRKYQRDKRRKHSRNVQCQPAPWSVSVCIKKSLNPNGLKHKSEGQRGQCCFCPLIQTHVSHLSCLEDKRSILKSISKLTTLQTDKHFPLSAPPLYWCEFIHSFTQGSEGESPADPVEQASCWKSPVWRLVTCKFICWSSFIMKQTSS